jgi:hypothetical protein
MAPMRQQQPQVERRAEQVELGRTLEFSPQARAAGGVVGPEELFHPRVFQRLDPHLGDRRLGAGQEGAVVEAPAGEHGPDAGRFPRQIRYELAPEANALAIISGPAWGISFTASKSSRNGPRRSSSARPGSRG